MALKLNTGHLILWHTRVSFFFSGKGLHKTSSLERLETHKPCQVIDVYDAIYLKVLIEVGYLVDCLNLLRVIYQIVLEGILFHVSYVQSFIFQDILQFNHFYLVEVGAHLHT